MVPAPVEAPAEVGGADSSGAEYPVVLLQDLFVYNPATDRLEPTGRQPSWVSA